MRAILRYPLIDLTYRQTLSIPTGFKPRHVAPGRAPDVAIDLWVEADLTNQPVPVDILIVGTGHQLPVGDYVGTVVMPDEFVWHVFIGVGNAR